MTRICMYMLAIWCAIIWKMSIMDMDTAFRFSAACFAGLALLGPTYCGIYLDPIQTPSGHMPAHILFTAAGVLGVLATA